MGNTAHTLIETVHSFEQQLQLFAKDINSENLNNFESLKVQVVLIETRFVNDLKIFENINP